MSSENCCPDCSQALIWQDQQYFCESCQHYVAKQVFCPDCDSEMERLNACGAASYFCNSCNELKSKSRAKVTFAVKA